MEAVFVVSNGLECLADKEIKDKKISEKTIVTPGRISAPVNHNAVGELFQLRSIEKVLLSVIEQPLPRSENPLPEDILQMIQSIQNEKWEEAINNWVAILKLEEILPLTFKVTVKIPKKCKIHDKTQMGKMYAEFLETKLNSIKEISHFQFEGDVFDYKLHILINFSKGKLLVGFYLTRSTLWKSRKYYSTTTFEKTSLKPSICYCLIKLLNLNSDSCNTILEPMAGSGMIIMELLDNRAEFSPRMFCIGGDISSKSVDIIKKNLSFTHCHSFLYSDVLHFSASCLPIQDNSIDGIVTDLPFGKRVGSKQDNKILYPQLMEEFFRVLKKNARAVLLTTNSKLLSQIVKSNRKWKLHHQIPFNHGGLLCYIFVVSKRYVPSKNFDKNKKSEK